MVGAPARRWLVPALFASVGAACALAAWQAIAPRTPGDPLDAARSAVRADPGDVEALHRLAHASAERAGGPTRETLEALDEAYRRAPFPPPDAMIWRVDFAERYWTSIPDPLAARTLTQVEALGRMGDRWQARVAWCRGARAPAIAEAACATAPGVERGLDLDPSEPPAAP